MVITIIRDMRLVLPLQCGIGVVELSAVSGPHLTNSEALTGLSRSDRAAVVPNAAAAIFLIPVTRPEQAKTLGSQRPSPTCNSDHTRALDTGLDACTTPNVLLTSLPVKALPGWLSAGFVGWTVGDRGLDQVV